MLTAATPNFPFPTHSVYTAGCILPNHVSRAEMDSATVAFYRQWKARFVRPAAVAKQQYIWIEENRNHQNCVSEGQGYGMTIVALMAGADAEAQTVFDELYAYVRAHPSEINKNLMAWAQDLDGDDIDRTSASDGDMDIAYALLLAAKQWGNSGAINYQQEAEKVIRAILKDEINPISKTIKLSDAVGGRSDDYFDTRTSDFMPEHFKAFEQATGDTAWAAVNNVTYKLFALMQRKYSPLAGLLPDFIRHAHTHPRPAHGHYLESGNDGRYYFNACRVPWRIAMDYLINGDKRSFTIVEKLNTFIERKTKSDPDKIQAGYHLSGRKIAGKNYQALSFIAPFAVSAMTNSKNQKWLNKLWDYTVKFPLESFEYYDNSIRLLNMIVLSGNYVSATKK